MSMLRNLKPLPLPKTRLGAAEQAGRALGAVVAIAAVTGCAPAVVREPPPTLSGTFQGVDDEGRDLRITFAQDENTLTGRGTMEDHPFAVSGLTSWHGPVLLSFEDGLVQRGRVALTSDGETVILEGMGDEPITLGRGAEPVPEAPGPFAGRYASNGVTPVTLTLAQHGDLLAGTGFVNGRPVGVVGDVIEPRRRARGTLLFRDGSRSHVDVELSGDGGTLTVAGFGAPFELARR